MNSDVCILPTPMSILFLMGNFSGWCQSYYQLNTRADCCLYKAGCFWIIGNSFCYLPNFSKHIFRVWISSWRITHGQKVVIHERRKKTSFSQEDHDDNKRHQENFSESNQSKNISGLEFYQRNWKSCTPPWILSEGVKNCERIAGEMNQTKKKHG